MTSSHTSATSPASDATPPGGAASRTRDRVRTDTEKPSASEVPAVKRSRGYCIAYPLLKPLLSMFLMLLFAVRGHHVERAVRQPYYILLSNHQSYPDPIFIGMVSPRPLHFMARDNLFRPGLKQLIATLGAYPVTRGRRDERAFRHTEGLLASRESVVIFGEGTRTPHGEIQPLRGGIEILARRTGAPIVPMALDGAYQMAPRTRSMKHLRAEAVHVVVGEPIVAEEYLAWPQRRIPEHLRPRLQELLDEARRRRERAGRRGLLTLTRPVIEGMTAYYRAFVTLLKAVARLVPRRGKSPSSSR